MSSLFLNEYVVLAEMTDSDKQFQAFVICIQKSTSLSRNDIYGWLASKYAPGSTILMFFKAEDNISLIFAC